MPLVTAGALILVMAFLSMSTAPSVEVRVMATGLGRHPDRRHRRATPPGPALVSLFGRWNSSLPGWTARLRR